MFHRIQKTFDGAAFGARDADPAAVQPYGAVDSRQQRYEAVLAVPEILGDPGPGLHAYAPREFDITPRPVRPPLLHGLSGHGRQHFYSVRAQVRCLPGGDASL